MLEEPQEFAGPMLYGNPAKCNGGRAEIRTRDRGIIQHGREATSADSDQPSRPIEPI